MPDYLILGGGLAGCAVASRLKEFNPTASITLIEAGPNAHDHEWMTSVMGTFRLHLSEFEYNYLTVPQKHYDGRRVYNTGGKQLSGSSSVNFANWSRGGKDDYDLWSKIVGDEKWSYDGQLPYFRRTETHYNSLSTDPHQHGFNGPIHTTASARRYPLTDTLKEAFLATGLPETQDANGGNPLGIAPYTENWRDGSRQPSGKAYGLDGVDVITNAFVRRILLTGNVATGAELLDGRIIHANKEVILSCGSIRSPQVLMLSGIGPKDELSKHGIEQLVNLPDVGRNFNDHTSLALFYRIKNPEKSLVAGAAGWNDPSYLLGMPADMMMTANADKEKLKAAMIKDGDPHVDDSHPHLAPSRGHIEIVPIYAPTVAPHTGLSVPFDGTCMTVGILNLLPTSRGSVTLASADPTADPLIDPNYYATETDREVMRQGVRLALKAIESPAGQRMIDSEVLLPDCSTPLTSESSDEEIDARVKGFAATWFHPTGSCSMGKVVDTELRVKGVEKLRVVDASVMPCPIGGHYQVPTYAIAEQAADLITKDNQ